MAHVRMNPALTAFSLHLLAKFTSFAKLSFIVGSKTACFAPAAVLLPLIGAFGGVSGSLLGVGLGVLVRVLLCGIVPLALLAYHLPGFIASLYWATNSRLLRSIPALACTILLLVHPVGSHAAWYSLFWLVPIFASFYSTVFARALGSSFTAHAVGTVVWLYAGQLAATDFALLAPVVIVERLMIAVSMVLAYKAIVYCYCTVGEPNRGCKQTSFTVIPSK